MDQTAISVLLIGEPKTGKTRTLETLPGGTVLFSFDRGGWHTLDASYDPPNAKARKRLKRLQFAKTFKEWVSDPNTKLAEDEILILEYNISDPIGLQQYVRSDTTLFLAFANDFNELWYKRAICESKGICAVCVDSLTTLKNPVLEFVMAINARVIATMQDWGQAISKVLEVIDSAKGAGFDFILTCHIQAEKDELTGRVKELPLIYGKGLPKEILTRFDDIFLMVSERGPSGMTYSWATVPEGLLSGVGTRSFDDLPGRIEPNFTKLYGPRLKCQKKEVTPQV